MNRLAMLYRAAQLYAHNAHNLAMGSTFFEDHEYLGELYGAYESAYDGIVERMIGLGMKVDLSKINQDAANLMAKMGASSPQSTAFASILEMESALQEEADAASKDQSSGTVNFLQGLNDNSEVRVYKIKRRLA